jgi:hypothetical protein
MQQASAEGLESCQTGEKNHAALSALPAVKRNAAKEHGSDSKRRPPRCTAASPQRRCCFLSLRRHAVSCPPKARMEFADWRSPLGCPNGPLGILPGNEAQSRIRFFPSPALLPYHIGIRPLPICCNLCFGLESIAPTSPSHVNGLGGPERHSRRPARLQLTLAATHVNLAGILREEHRMPRIGVREATPSLPEGVTHVDGVGQASLATARHERLTSDGSQRTANQRRLPRNG